MSVDEIIKVFNEFVPFSPDDPVHRTQAFLNDLMDKWEEAEGKNKAIPAIFRLMERYPHAEFGMPGPMVHALEAGGSTDYFGELQLSLLRRPTPLTLWMYNRIINMEKSRRMIEAHIEQLRIMASHPFADRETQKRAQEFIDHQLSRLG